MKKKGEALSQPFIYIFVIFVAAVIIIFGSKIVVDLLKLETQVETNILIKSIENRIKSCYNLDKGSTCYFENTVVSNEINKICFVNPEENIEYDKFGDELTIFIVKNSVENNEGFNLFLIPKQGKELDKTKHFLINIVSSENPLCEDLSDGKFNLILENEGQVVRVRKE